MSAEYRNPIYGKQIIQRRGLSYVITAVLSSTMCVYAAKYTQFSPIYIVYLITMPISIAYAANYIDHIFFPKDSRILGGLLFYVITMILSFQVSSIFGGEFINLFLSIYAYIFIRFLRKRIPEHSYNKIIKNMIRITLLLLTIDTVYRVLHPNFTVRTDYLESNFFYYYKKNSIMFADSNTTGLVCLILYFFLKQLQYIGFLKKRSSRTYEIMLIILLLFSFSRAAYIAFICGFIYEKVKTAYDKSKGRTIVALLVVVPLLLVIGIAVFYRLYQSDLSFQSKFEIIQKAIDVFGGLDTKSKLFGIGFNGWADLLGIYTHNIFITYILFTGLTGFAIFAIYLLYSLRYLDIILIPFIIVSLSFFSYLGMPFLFVPLAIAYNIYENCNDRNNLARS